MSAYTFDIKTSADLLKKLEEDFLAFRADDLSSSKALTCAMSAWHLTDWIHSERSTNPTSGARGLFQKRITSQYPFLAVMHDVANGGKHLKLERPRTDIVSSYAVGGSHSNDHGYDHDVPCLMLSNAVTEIIFMVELDKAIQFWRANLATLKVD